MRLAEESGVIQPIGKWVLRTARAWQDQGPTGTHVGQSLRTAARSGRTVDEVREVLEATGLSPAYLELELTESSVMTHAGQAENWIILSVLVILWTKQPLAPMVITTVLILLNLYLHQKQSKRNNESMVTCSQ